MGERWGWLVVWVLLVGDGGSVFQRKRAASTPSYAAVRTFAVFQVVRQRECSSSGWTDVEQVSVSSTYSRHLQIFTLFTFILLSYQTTVIISDLFDILYF